MNYTRIYTYINICMFITDITSIVNVTLGYWHANIVLYEASSITELIMLYVYIYVCLKIIIRINVICLRIQNIGYR